MIDSCKWYEPTEPMTRSLRAILLLRKRKLLKLLGIKSGSIMPTRKHELLNCDDDEPHLSAKAMNRLIEDGHYPGSLAWHAAENALKLDKRESA